MLLAAYYHPILATLFGFWAILVIIVILLQRGKGVGLSGAFGGAGGHTAFGAKTGDVLTWATVAGAVVLLTAAVAYNYVFVPLKPFAPPPPLVTPIAPLPVPETETPRGTADETPAPTEEAAPVRPDEMTPPADATVPADAQGPGKPAPPQERETPGEAEQTP